MRIYFLIEQAIKTGAGHWALGTGKKKKEHNAWPDHANSFYDISAFFFTALMRYFSHNEV